MRDSRLFRILYYILEKGKVTANELSEKFEVSVRTIYRDIDVISSAGIPIYATQGKGGGIEIADDLDDPKTGQAYKNYLSQLNTSDVRKLEHMD